MSSETVVAAKILCEARSRQKLRELGQNYIQDNFEPVPTPLSARQHGEISSLI